MKFAGRVTFAGRVKLFKTSVRLAAELFVTLSLEPCHQVLRDPRLIVVTALWKYSKLRAMFGLSGEESSSSAYASAILARTNAPVVGSLFPGLKTGRFLSEFHTTTFKKVVSCAGAPLSASATNSRQSF